MCHLKVLEHLLAMGEVLNLLPRITSGVLASPVDEALGCTVVHAEAQDFLHLALFVTREGVNAQGWLWSSVLPLPKL